jgi:hypothetical protein
MTVTFSLSRLQEDQGAIRKGRSGHEVAVRPQFCFRTISILSKGFWARILTNVKRTHSVK